MRTTPAVDTARLGLMLNELRLPTIKLVWPQFAEQADKEGWPAARFLAAIAEHELAERDRRRIERHLAEARLPPGKTLDTFDFEAVPMISKAQVMAIAAGDSWLDNGANLLLFGPPGGGKSHLASAIGLALVENGWRGPLHPHHRPRPEAPGRPPRTRPRGRHQPARPLRPPDPRRPRLRHQGPGRDQRPVRADQRTLRAPLDPHHRQPAVRRMGQGLPRSRHDARRRRPPRPSLDDLRDERRELSTAHRPRTQTRSRATAVTRDTEDHRLIDAPRQSTSEIALARVNQPGNHRPRRDTNSPS